MLRIAPSSKAFEKALNDVGIKMKNLEGNARGAAIAFDVLNASQDRYTGKMLDFSGASMGKLEAAMSVYEAQLNGMLEAQEKGFTHTASGIAVSDKMIEMYRGQMSTLLPLIESLQQYSDAMDVKNGKTEEDTETTDTNTQSTKAATAASGSLNDTIKERNELLKKQMTAISRAATGFAKLGKELGVNEKAIMALQAVAALANAHMAASDVLADAKIRPTWLRVAAAAGMYAQGIAHVMGIKSREPSRLGSR